MSLKLPMGRIGKFLKGSINSVGVERVAKNSVSFILFMHLIYTIGRYSQEIVAGGHPYLTGDWLINYEGGYNGRGLFGQLVLSISDFFNLSLLWTTYAFQCLLYVIYIPIVISIFRAVRTPLVFMIGLSPFFVMFDFLDTGGAFRKELIGFAGLILVINLLFRESFVRPSVYLSMTLYVLFLFSWDVAFVFLPFYFYVFNTLQVKGLISRRFLVNFRYFFVVLGLFSVLRAVFFLSNRPSTISDGICDSLIDRGLTTKVCDGTIRSLTELETNSANMIRTLFAEYNFGVYFLLLLLGLVPFVINGWLKQNLRVTILLFGSVAPLFLVGADYGRWVHIFGTLLTFMWVISQQIAIDDGSTQSIRAVGTKRQINLLLLSVIYVFSWRIPVAWGTPLDALLGLGRRILSWLGF